MPHPDFAAEVTYALSEVELVDYHRLIVKRQAKFVPPRRSWFSALYVPLALGTLLGAVVVLWSDVGSAGFGSMLAVGFIAYLAGYFALRYELSRDATPRTAAIFRANPLFHEPKQVTLGSEALEQSCASMSAHYRYGAITEVEVTRGLVLGWLGTAAAVLVPVRAFPNASDAEAFATELRNRVASSRSR
jgi:hypothetical protein